MTGGAGFTKDGLGRIKVNRANLKKKAPFQRLADNLFGKKAPVIKIAVDRSTLDELQKIKKSNRKRETVRKRLVTIGLFITMILIFFWLFGRYL